MSTFSWGDPSSIKTHADIQAEMIKRFDEQYSAKLVTAREKDDFKNACFYKFYHSPHPRLSRVAIALNCDKVTFTSHLIDLYSHEIYKLGQRLGYLPRANVMMGSGMVMESRGNLFSASRYG